MVPKTNRSTDTSSAYANDDDDHAWRHVAALVAAGKTDKPLLLAAIDAIVSIRPEEAPEVLADLMDSDDEDITDAVYEALTMEDALFGGDYPDEENDDELLH